TLWDGLHTALRGRASAVAAKQVEGEPAVHATAERVPVKRIPAESVPRKFVEQEPERPIDWPVELPDEQTVVAPPVVAARETDSFDAPTRRFHPIVPPSGTTVGNGHGHGHQT
ncbi:MAG TPA: hypothetical protein VGH57_32895, partial [Amycolatopsis sp.]